MQLSDEMTPDWAYTKVMLDLKCHYDPSYYYFVLFCTLYL